MDQTVAYGIISEAKGIIMKSTNDIEQTFKNMSSNISTGYGSEDATALSGKAGAAVATAWSDLADREVPLMRNELTTLTEKKLYEWGNQYGITEDKISQLFQQS